MGELYRITFPSGKAYIGITSKTAEKRLAEHLYVANRQRWAHLPIYRAIAKYGPEALRLETLAVVDDWEELCALERRAIAEHGTRSPYGYNATDGGEGQLGRKRIGFRHSPESKAKMSARRKGKPLPSAHKANVIAALRGRKYPNRKPRGHEVFLKQAASMIAGDLRPNSTSGVKGVTRCRTTNRWRAHITVGGKMRTIGRFDCFGAAVLARKSTEREVLRGLVA